MDALSIFVYQFCHVYVPSVVLERLESVKGQHISEYKEEKRLKRIRKAEEKNEKIRLATERRRGARQSRGRNGFTERPSSASFGSRRTAINRNNIINTN